MFCRTSLADVTSDLEELQYRWQQIEACCRLDLGVCTSFLCSESTDSPIQSAKVSGKIKTLNTECTSSRESPPLHRVYTYPILQQPDETPPPSYNMATTKHSFERHSSDPSGSTSDHNPQYEYEYNGSSMNRKPSKSDIVDGLDNNSESAFNEQNHDSSNQQQDASVVHDGEANSSKNSRKNGSFHEDKSQSLSNLEEKSTSVKKKWWSRGKKQHSEESNHEKSSFHLSKSKGSMPMLSQR